MKALYFAYGLSLEELEMTNRMPSARFYKFSVLSGFALSFDGNANITPKPNSYVEGIVYSVNHNELEKPIEGSTLSLIDVQTDSGEWVSALTYIRSPNPNPKTPSEEYVMRIFKKYQDYGFNTKHIEEALECLT